MSEERYPPDEGAPSAAERLQQAVGAVTDRMALASGGLFLLLAVYIGADVILRYGFGLSTAASDEIGGYALAVGGALAFAYALRAGAHVRIDVLLPHLPAPARALLSWAAMALMAVFAVLLAVAVWRLALDSYQTDARAVSYLRTPLVLPQALMALGLTVLGVEAVVSLIAAAVESARTGRLASPGGTRSEDLPARDQEL
ncbi:MAG TPA: TRAP transporter small permease [Burkholderiales bacterium]|jgi:TRAP-type C4-dicarboxylate transport system permease small subunit